MTKKSAPKTKNELVLFTSQIEYLCMHISKEQFKEYKDVGMPYEDHEEFNNSADYCEPIFDDRTTLKVDGEEIKEFTDFMKDEYKKHLHHYETQITESKKTKSKDISYAVIGDRWTKRSWYKLSIKDDFDFSKLSVIFTRNVNFDSSLCDTFTLFYSDEEIEFSESYSSNSDSEYLATSDGKTHYFEVLEEVWDDDVEDE
jgi:hypothetical protein